MVNCLNKDPVKQAGELADLHGSIKTYRLLASQNFREEALKACELALQKENE